MLSLFKKRDKEIVAIFDIGNGSIGGALVRFQKNDTPVVLYSHREPLTFVAHATSAKLMTSMLKLLKSVAEKLTKDGLAHVSTSPFGSHKLRDAYCVFAAPWYISQTKVVKQSHQTPVTITRERINELVAKEQELFNKSLSSSEYQHIFGSDSRLLEKRIINVRLNGYEVAHPFGKQARELDLTLFSSFISKTILAKVEDTLHHTFSVRSVHHYSYGFVSWGVSRILFPDVHDYFFVDVSGETTDISLVVKDVLIETVSFPIGKSTILRKIVRDLKVEPDIAVSFLSMYVANTLSKSFTSKLESIISALETDWHDSFVTALHKFQKIYSLPRSTFLTCDQDVSHLYLNALSKQFPPELNLAKSTLAPTYIGADTVDHYIELLPKVNQDSFIAVESIFLNNLF